MPVPTTPQSPANPGRAFTQEDVNRLLADDRRKHQAKIDQIQRTLEEVSASKSLTSQEREQLLTQIEAMEAEKRTKEQQLAHEKSQLEKQHAKALADEKKNVESCANASRPRRSTMHCWTPRTGATPSMPTKSSGS